MRIDKWDIGNIGILSLYLSLKDNNINNIKGKNANIPNNINIEEQPEIELKIELEDEI